MEVVIRRASAEDIPAVHAIEVRAFPTPWRREFFEGELQAAGRFNLVAVRDATVVGYLFAMYILDEMHINKIAVAEEERRRGIAARLMDECLRFARRTGMATISLEVRRSNSGAQEFYRRLDFKPVYMRPRYYPDGEAAVVMARDLMR
ncbi:MAG TPA: ribosomal protein S18-alanine N-acetyltransferase [Thermoanaerobaculia bacterium]|nr:ribosomal protein S18-alanine N-acetyltransferase [Thermoanaerobaculia bacterium]